MHEDYLVFFCFMFQLGLGVSSAFAQMLSAASVQRGRPSSFSACRPIRFLHTFADAVGRLLQATAKTCGEKSCFPMQLSMTC